MSLSVGSPVWQFTNFVSSSDIANNGLSPAAEQSPDNTESDVYDNIYQ